MVFLTFNRVSGAAHLVLFVLVKVYAVLVNIFRYVQSFVGVRRRGANCKFVVDVSKGANDGFLTLVADSYNGSGIAPNKELLGELSSNFSQLTRAALLLVAEGGPFHGQGEALAPQDTTFF